jgi:putative oxidoreductase
MKKTDLLVRIILGIGLVFFGLNGFFHWMTPPAGPEEETQFLISLGSAGYIYPVVYLVLTFSGVTFLLNRLVPIGLLILAPILLNIVLIHLNFNPEGVLFGAIFFLLMLVLFFTRWKEFQPLFNNN